MKRYIFNSRAEHHSKYTSIRFILYSFGIFCWLVIFSFSFARQENSEEEALAIMQTQLNQEVMSKAFLAEKPKEVDAYIKDMMNKKLPHRVFWDLLANRIYLSRLTAPQLDTIS